MAITPKVGELWVRYGDTVFIVSRSGSLYDPDAIELKCVYVIERYVFNIGDPFYQRLDAFRSDQGHGIWALFTGV